jgi:hypothetical protein
MDAGYFLSPGYRAAERLALAKASGLRTFKLGGRGGVARVWKPQRIAFARAAPGEPAVPYIRPYGMFQYLPQAADELSRHRNRNLTAYEVERGMVLQTRSGRNLGPLTVADAYLERFVMSDDLLRIEFEDEQLRDYAVAFLSGPTGQSLIRQGKSGSVVDHLTEAHMEAQEVPIFDDALVEAVAAGMNKAVRLREEARVALSEALDSYEASLPSPVREQPAKEGWAVQATDLTSRLDAASYDPWVAAVRAALLDAGGKEVSKVADVLKPAGRYKTFTSHLSMAGRCCPARRCYRRARSTCATCLRRLSRIPSSTSYAPVGVSTRQTAGQRRVSGFQSWLHPTGRDGSPAATLGGSFPRRRPTLGGCTWQRVHGMRRCR